ncbi:ATP12 family chaperone protein [Dongia sedimenti]|uniref:ATP12 family protein n=1 Tax=Dongia sedimenti TaxID=3064282 RepID=A0ABU0YEC6_9PROT|nr:ATP12 family protein [Rhodospirillaceae bacterium R-7]
MSIDVNRRFYREAAAVQDAEGWRIALDGKVVKTPARNPLLVPTRALAEAIAGEWAAQDTKVRPDTMPLMQFASTAIDRVAPDRDRIVAETAGYAATDLVCYRAEAPAELVARQAAAWDPLIDWLRERYDVALQVATGVMAIPQSDHALAGLTRAVAAQDDHRLTALAVMTGASGSLALALAVLEDRIGPEAAADAAQLDELFQAERWGIDPEAEKRRAAQRADLVAARRFLDLLATGAA